MKITQKKRSEIAQEYKWKLTDIFESVEAWHAAFDATGARLEKFAEYKGNLTDGQAILSCLDEAYALADDVFRLYAYSQLLRDTDTAEPTAQALADKAQGLYVKFTAAVSFIKPEILAMSADTIRGFISDTAGLEIYRHYLEEILRGLPHVRSAEVEAVLAAAGEMKSAPGDIFNMLNNADIKFPTVTDENGNEVEITHGRYGSLMKSTDRRVRRETFEKFYDSFHAMKNSFATMHAAGVKNDVFYARQRGHSSARAAALFNNNIPEAVYDSLISAVHASLPAMHRYMKLRKRVMGLDEMHMYDLSVPIVDEVDANIEYAPACEKFLKGIVPLGEKYLADVKKGMESSWLDVYESEGKRSGAYSWGVAGVHPFVLLNYENKIRDLFTLAHEMGHAMHSFYSDATQPPVYKSYTIFLAEVASTVNECLLMDYMLKNETDPKMRLFLLGEQIEQFRGTVFRQTMFAEFEMLTHRLVEEGKPLTLETLNTIHRELVVKYHGPDVVADERIDLEWARVPHFYRAFYVYQYATGFSAAMAFAKKITTEGQPAIDKYLEFLAAGSSDSSIEILKKAGVDMTDPQTVQSGLAMFEELVAEMETAYA
jgi:oligoendopeptidase F